MEDFEVEINKFGTLIKTARRAGNQENWQVFNDIVNQLYLNEDLTEKQRKIISDLELSFLDDEWQRFKPLKDAEDAEDEDLVKIHSDNLPDNSPSKFNKKLKIDEIVVQFHTRSLRNQDKSALKNKLQTYIQQSKQVELKKKEIDNSEFAGMSLAKRAARRAAARKAAKKKLEAELKMKEQEAITEMPETDTSDVEPSTAPEDNNDKEKVAELMHQAALDGFEKAAKMKMDKEQQEIEQLEREQQEQEKLRLDLAEQEKIALEKIEKEKAEVERITAEKQALEEMRAKEMEQFKDAFALFKKASVQPNTQGDKIVELCTQAIEIYPDYDEAYFLRSSIYSDRNEYDNQIADLSRVVQILRQKEMPNKEKALSKVFKKLGKVFVAISDWENAIKSYTSILKYDPESQSAYLNRGLIWQEMQVMDKALEDFEAAIEINSEKIDPYVLSSKILIQNEEYEKAIQYLTIIHDADPDNIDTIYERGECYFNLKQYDEAMKDLTIVFDKRPRDIQVILLRAQILVKHKEWEDAEEELTRIIQIDPDNIEVFRLRSEVFKRLGKKDEARLDSKRFRKLESDKQAQLNLEKDE